MKMKLGNYELSEEIGKGQFGKVFLGIKVNDDKKYGIKQMERAKIDNDPQKRTYFETEVSNLKKLEGNPNIIKFIEVLKTTNHYYVVTELANGGVLKNVLYEYINKNKKPFSEEIVQYFMKQLCKALYDIHEKKIIHRDLKLENILLHYTDEDDKKNMNLMKAQIKVIDFGVSIDLNQGCNAQTGVGSGPNMAPTILEKFMGKKEGMPYDNKIDIWSLGTIFYEMLFGKPPFQGKEPKEVYDYYKKIEGKFFVSNNIHLETVLFLLSMLAHEGSKRKSAHELLNMPFLNKKVENFTKFEIKK